jgi:hypothetical protein
MDGKTRDALAVVIHHERDAQLRQAREEIERLKRAKRISHYLRACLSLIEYDRINTWDSRAVAVILKAELVRPHFDHTRLEDDDARDVSEMPRLERLAVIPQLQALGYDVIETPNRATKIGWHHPDDEEMKDQFLDMWARLNANNPDVDFVLHDASRAPPPEST